MSSLARYTCRNVRATAHPQVETDRVLVTEWRFAPGAETGQHIHAHDYVVVPLTTGKLRLLEPGGVREVELQAGVSYARPKGVAHNVVNANAYEFRFVEIELK
jgi:beta-alanine degradation protein BauB